MTPLVTNYDRWMTEWTSKPHTARLTHYFLGGKDHYTRDRALARDLEMVTGWPWPTATVLNRAFGAMTAQMAARRGLPQFLDLGCGYPTPPVSADHCANVHRAIAGISPGAPVVYVDNHGAVMAPSRVLLEEGPPHNVRCVQADVADMDALLLDPELHAVLDPARPIAVSVHDVLPWITCDATVNKSMAALRDWLPPGSVPSITHLTGDFAPHDVEAAAGAFAEHGLPVKPRAREEIAALFGDWTHLGAGLAPTGAWHAEHPRARLQPEASLAWAGVAVKEPALP